MHVWGADRVLDTELFYTAAQAQSFFQSLEPLESQTYLLHETLDLVFLSSYGALFFLMARKFELRGYLLAFVPGVFDLIETVTIIFLLLNRIWSPPFWLGYVTCLKWATGGIVLFSLLAGFAKRKKERRPLSNNSWPS